MANKADMLADREAGMKYEDIAKKHGVSYQYVAFTLARYYPPHFAFVKEAACIYPNLRRWMNENKVSRSEFVRRMGFECLSETINRFSDIMKGKRVPKKDWIDAMLRVTGMSYECLFDDRLWKD